MKYNKEVKRKINNKGMKGITLIALVITIIVLLILAGISISMLAGDNGVLKQATRAKDAARGGEIEEIVKLEATSNSGAEYIGGTKKERAQVISELHSEKKLTDEEVAILEKSDTITIGGITIDFSVLGASTNSSTLVAMFQKAVTDKCTNEDGSCSRTDHLHIGHYVEYTNPTSGEWTVPVNELGCDEAQTYIVSQNQLNWRVLGIVENEGNAYIKLIAGSPMKKSKEDKSGINESDPHLFMWGAESYINAVTQLNKICALYKTNIATKAESVTLDDIDKLTGVTTEDLKKHYNIDAFDGFLNYGEPYSFSNHYTPDNWIKTPKTKTTVSGNVNGYYYIINKEMKPGAPYVSVKNKRIYYMLFDNIESRTGKSYWLASVGVTATSDYATFAPALVEEYEGLVGAGIGNMFYSDGDEEDCNYCGVRPVVHLKPEVTNEQCKKTKDKIEEEWNYE